MIGKTQSLFLSSDVKSIYANMSSKEYSNIEWEIYKYERWYGLTIGIFIFAILNSNPIAKILTLILFLLQILKNHKTLKTLLCSTEWAKTQGYKPDTLKLFSLPFFSKKGVSQ